ARSRLRRARIGRLLRNHHRCEDHVRGDHVGTDLLARLHDRCAIVPLHDTVGLGHVTGDDHRRAGTERLRDVLGQRLERRDLIPVRADLLPVPLLVAPVHVDGQREVGPRHVVLVQTAVQLSTDAPPLGLHPMRHTHDEPLSVSRSITEPHHRPVAFYHGTPPVVPRYGAATGALQHPVAVLRGTPLRCESILRPRALHLPRRAPGASATAQAPRTPHLCRSGAPTPRPRSPSAPPPTREAPCDRPGRSPADPSTPWRACSCWPAASSGSCSARCRRPPPTTTGRRDAAATPTP